MDVKVKSISNIQMLSLTIFMIVILYVLLILLMLSHYETMGDELARIKQELRVISTEIKELKCSK